MSFGIRRAFIQTEDGDGVQMVDIPDDSYIETVQGKMLASSLMNNALKYTPPSIETLVDVDLTREMKEMLTEYMDVNLMTDGLQMIWQKLLDEDRNDANIY